MSWLSQAGKAVGKGIRDIGREAERVIPRVAPVASWLPGANAVLGVATGVARVAGALGGNRRPLPSRSSNMSMQFGSNEPPMPVLRSTLPVGPAPSMPSGGGMQLAGAIVGPLGQTARGIAGGMIGDWLGRTFGPGGTTTGTAAGGCGCKSGSNGRDACTGQRTTSLPAPKATLFGGCCPPGRTLRRMPLGRDICIKSPKLNVFNPRALARADARVTGFARRAAPILKDLGFTVTSTRKKAIHTKSRKRR